jgi:hypothetical protein
MLFEWAGEWHRTVDELLDGMDSHELSEWLVYFRMKSERREREKNGLGPPETRESLRARLGHRIKKKAQ